MSGSSASNTFISNSNQIASSVRTELSDAKTSTTLTSAGTTITVSGLDLETDQCYNINLTAIPPAAAKLDNISMTCNADTTASNYYCQNLTVSGAATSAALANTAVIGSCGMATPAQFFIRIAKVSGEETHAEIFGLDHDGSFAYRIRGWYWTATTNVTSITFTCASNQFQIGSKAVVRKL